MIRYSLHKYIGVLAVCLAAALLASCDKYTSHVDDLVAALPDTWDDCDDAIENYSVEQLKELEADPGQLAKETQADYIKLGNLFILKQPIDHTARAIGSAIFGEFADLAYAVDDASIENKTKKPPLSLSTGDSMKIGHFSLVRYAPSTAVLNCHTSATHLPTKTSITNLQSW